MNDSSRLATFDQHRGFLFSVSYRLLGSVADTEDILQEAFLRWQQTSEEEVRSPKAFLVTRCRCDAQPRRPSPAPPRSWATRTLVLTMILIA